MKVFRIWYYIGDSAELSYSDIEASTLEQALNSDKFDAQDILIDRYEVL